jgi:hypothetical protein
MPSFIYKESQHKARTVVQDVWPHVLYGIGQRSRPLDIHITHQSSSASRTLGKYQDHSRLLSSRSHRSRCHYRNSVKHRGTVGEDARITCIPDTVGSTNESLEGDVGYQLTQGTLQTRQNELLPINWTSRTRRSQGSSYKKRMATSKVAPPHISRLNAFARA